MCEAQLSATFQALLEAETVYRVGGEPRDESREDEEKRRSNEKWRSRIVDWKYQVIDHYGYSRELVSISMSILDRYSSLRAASKKCYQLAAMSSLHLAIKLSSPARLCRFDDLVGLSRGYFTRDHVLVMEGVVLEEVSWRVHPVTPCVIVRHLLLLCPEESVEQVLEVAIFLTELAVCDSYFVPLLSSTIALSSILSAFRALPHLPAPTFSRFSVASAEHGFDIFSQEVISASSKLDSLSGSEEAVTAPPTLESAQPPVTPGRGQKQRNLVSPTDRKSVV